uniref:NADH-ubiquinone oxidoreductase chain 4L n=1 Tax=Crossobamon orientalis TaxID=401522 RepID=A0A7R7G211_9SAUR|nr:NADH dehydrogenase subunit 4L [Crossobamon orientalis]
MTPLQFTTYATFSISLTGFSLCRKHLVSALLCLEGTMLALFMVLTTISQTTTTTTATVQPIALLTISACEAAAGLSLLIASARTHSSDHMKNLNLLMC